VKKVNLNISYYETIRIEEQILRYSSALVYPASEAVESEKVGTLEGALPKFAGETF
jgi:hypothetical protein